MDDLHEVGLGDAVREPHPVLHGRAGRLGRENLDHRDSVLGQEDGLPAAEEPAAEDHGYVGVCVVGVEGPRSQLDLVPRVLEERDELGLPAGENEHSATRRDWVIRPHGGMIPAAHAFEASAAGTLGDMKIETLDHVALWVADRDTLADFLTTTSGMHVIDRTDRFTLVGSDARRGKLTLFAAEGERDPGVLAQIGLRVLDLEEALAELPAGARRRARRRTASFEAPERLRLVLVESDGGVAYDLDHVLFRVPDPERSFAELSELGFARRGRRVCGWGTPTCARARAIPARASGRS